MLSLLRRGISGRNGDKPPSEDGQARTITRRPESNKYRATVEDQPSDKKVIPEQDVPAKGPNAEPDAQRKTQLDAAAKAASEADIKAETIIAIMGLTGTGKSTFIKLLTGLDVKIGHNLAACTADVGIYGFQAPGGQSVALIDTPGFDDTYRSDTEVLQDVAYFLGQVYAQKLKLAGIIYLHRITDNRMGGSALRNLNMFEALCGKVDMSHVVLATTMWDTLQDDESHRRGATTEMDLRTNYWADMLEFGSHTFRHDNTRESALKITNYILSLQGNMVLKIQREMVDDKRTLYQTLAGQELQRELVEERAKHARDLESARKSHEAAMRSGDQRMIDKMARQEREYKAKLDKLDHEKEERIRILEQDFQRMHEDKDREYKQMIADLEKQLEETSRNKESSLRELENMQRKFDAQMEKSNSDRRAKDADLRAQLEHQKSVNETRIAVVQAELAEYKKHAAKLQDQKDRPAVVSALQVLTGGGLLALGVMKGSTTLVATGSGILSSGVSNLAG
ncbi:P-loop containing nucleoside triphosphate hydrolase protein [Lasiosphaeria miniovina]|uniref:P-loop containing nucleoside triphosphate hydrolase protein n=1 Tax=Lasiosphaeria miniovina TaxID=1954250 RepID=A0AA39ZYY6_9PEZI|nr:P-loop containing nucleoside triphosphate hydrolase protein [Lasiosphaeria miniovina]KAK0706213.1 P-loop containing nucleoside triphosphate hydrolase protein [Lasiosphaeria miniovina]